MKTHRQRLIRRSVVTLMALTLCAAAAIAVRDAGNKAYAEEVRVRGVSAYRDVGRFSAEIVESEPGEQGRRRERRLSVTCDGPARYRTVVREADANGKPVVTTMLKIGNDLFTHTQDASGSRLHVVRNIPPGLGIAMDNALGQRIRTLKEAPDVRFMGRDKVRDRKALKLEVGEEHVVWLDEVSALPLKEQSLAGDIIAEETEFVSFDPEPTIRPEDFDPDALTADTVIEEDLGFTSVEHADAATMSALGFVPVPTTAAMSGTERVSSGFVGPRASAEGGSEPVWVEQFVADGECTLISQMSRPGIDVTGAEWMTTESFAGGTITYEAGEWRTLANFKAGDILIVIESTLPIDDVIAIASAIAE